MEMLFSLKLPIFTVWGPFYPPRPPRGGSPAGPTRVKPGKDKGMDLKGRWGMHVAPHCLAHGRGCGECVRRARVSLSGDDRSNIDMRAATETKTTTTCSWSERRRQAIRLPAKPSHFAGPAWLDHVLINFHRCAKNQHTCDSFFV